MILRALFRSCADSRHAVSIRAPQIEAETNEIL